MSQRQGFVLITAVMLLIFASIAVLGLSFFIIGRSKLLNTSEASLKSIYLSEAGVQEAIYWFRENGYFSLGTYTVAPNETYTLDGDDADLLMVDTRQTTVRRVGFRYRLRDIGVKSATDSRSLMITDMLVTWSDAGFELTGISIGGSTVWSGTASSPANCNITDTTITRTRRNVVLIFNGDPSSQTVSIRFIMQDGTYKELQVYPASDQFNFTVESQGEVNRVPVPLSTTIESEYNAANSRIVHYSKGQ